MPGVSLPNRPAYRTNPKKDQIKMKTKRENEKAKEVSTKPSHTTLSTKSIMLTRAMPQVKPQRYSSSLSFSLPKVPISTPTWLKNVRDDFFHTS